MKRNLLDKVIEAFSPQSAAKRYYFRFQLDKVRRFEAASKGRRTDGWRTPSTDANGAFLGLLQTMRNRSRDLVRNNPYAQRAVQVISTNTVGKGIKGEAKVSGNKTKADRFQAEWENWAETTEIDADGKHNFYGLQRLAMRCVAESGSVIIRKRRRRFTDGRTAPLQIQILEPDFIDTSKEGKSGSNVIIQGREFSSTGKPVAYWLFEEHPGNSLGFGSFKSVRVPASEIIYMYRSDRIGQIHGIPWGVSAFIRLKDFDDYEDAQLLRQKIAACFTAFVYDSTGADNLTGLDSASNSGNDNGLADKFEPGMIEFLPSGKDIRIANPPAVSNYGEYTSAMLHSIAIAYNVPYEALTNDYSKTNYSSSRATWLQFHKDLDEWQEIMLIPQMCNGIFDWFKQALSLTGQDTKGVGITWIPPRRHLIDPTKEIPAIIKQIRSGLMSHKRALRELGFTPDEIYEEIKQSNEIFDENNLTLDSDPRKVTGGGSLQKEEENSNEKEPE